MKKRLIRVAAVMLVMLTLAGANPFRIIPSEMIYVGDTVYASTAQRQDFFAVASAEEGKYLYDETNNAEPTEEPRRARVVNVVPDALKAPEVAQATDAPKATTEPISGKTAQNDAEDKRKARAADTQVTITDEDALESSSGEAPGEAGLAEGGTLADAQQDVEELLAEISSSNADASGGEVIWEPTPAPTPVAKAAQNAANNEKVSKTTKAPKATAHPVLGTVEKTWQVSEDGLSVRVDRRKIGSSVAFIAVIRAKPDRMHTYTVAGPGKTASFKYTSTLAKGVGAVVAINGDCYDYKTRRGMGIVARNGVLYNNKAYGRWSYIVYENGGAKIIQDYNVDVEKELMKGAKDIYAFGPALVRDGKFVKPSAENTHPRTAIGRVDNNTWIMIVVDGRQSGYSVGMKYKELANLFIAYGCDTAYNLDGGGSSAIWLKGYGVLNKPSDGKERSTPDIIYFN